MCLAVPMKIIEINGNGNTGIVEMDGATTKTSFSLIDNPRLGDYVIIHAGFAIERIDTEEAAKQISLFREISEYKDVKR